VLIIDVSIKEYVEMMNIPKNELAESLKYGYENYKTAVENGADEIELAHIKGFCTTIEQILSAYGDFSLEDIMKIKRPIIGEISLRYKSTKLGINLEEPTYLRNQKRKC